MDPLELSLPRRRLWSYVSVGGVIGIGEEAGGSCVCTCGFVFAFAFVCAGVVVDCEEVVVVVEE